MKNDYSEISEIFKALGHRARLEILIGIKKDQCSVSEIVKKMNMPQPTVSQHLAVLRNNGIIEAKKEGVITCYYIVDERVKKILKVVDR